MTPLLCIAHRGGPLSNETPTPENSLQAIAHSLELGVPAIEIDLWQVAGELVVTHDRRLGKVVAGEGLITDKSPAELNALRLSNGEPLPRLMDVLRLIGDRALLNIEIKGPDTLPLLISRLRAWCHDNQLAPEQYLISSFDHHQLYQSLQLAPEFRRGVLIEGIPLDYARCCEALQAYSFNTHLSFLNQALVDDAHRRGLQHWVYTANHPEDWRWLVQLGVDGVFTDRPAELLAFNATLSAQS